MHPRVGLHQVAFAGQSAAGFLDHCLGLGVQNVTLVTSLLAADDMAGVRARLADGGVRAAVLNHPFALYPDLADDRGQASEKLLAAIDVAGELGAPTLYVLTGGRGNLTWEQAAQRFAELTAPGRAAADAAGIRLLVENASPFNADIHIAHTLTDTLTLAEIADVGVCIDLHACWMEAGLTALVERALPVTGLVQVSDYVLGDRSAPCRAVPGDGVIPLRAILSDVLALGYSGVFDLELVGPRIAAEGAEAATARAAANLSELLTELGA